MLMSNSPAFQLYAADFYMDTGEWTVEEIGVFTRLLFSEWVNGDLPNDPQRLARVAGCGSKKFKKAWSVVAKKFTLNGQQRLINKKMETVREEQCKYRESQSEAGKRGAKKRWEEHSNPNDNPNGGKIALQSSPSSLNKKTYVDTSNEVQLATLLLDLILERKPTFKKPNIQIWALHVDRMISTDKREPTAIRDVIKWSQESEFWQNNILSTSKLRKQFDQLELKMTAEGGETTDTPEDKAMLERLKKSNEEREKRYGKIKD